jgi:CheY-like chemotaxis protein
MARILVVEDDPGQLEVRKLIMEQAGHEVLTAHDASTAIENLPGCQLVLMDFRIPTTEDGLQLIRAASGQARIVVLSGAQPDVPLPVDEFLAKPCSSRKLLEAIAKLCLLLCLPLLMRAETFRILKSSEVVAELSLRAPGTDWAETGHEAALATVLVDGHRQQQIMLYGGAESFSYTVFLGVLSSGEHRVDVRGDGVQLVQAKFREDASDVVANAPVLFARANTVGKYTDIPLIVYCERLSGNGEPFLQYTVIFSNEDGGTSTRALMARWGRTTDIEYVYRAFLTADGRHVRRATIQAKDHKELEFRGTLDGSHPLLMPITDNNMIGEADTPTPVRYQIAPILVDLTGHSREQVMDQHPFAYRVMAKELKREGKLRPFGIVDGEKVSDPIDYLYFEMKLTNSEASVATLVRLKDNPRWHSSHLGHADYAIRTWKRNSAESPKGFVRTTVELPPGTTANQIAEIGFECLVLDKAADSPCGVEAVTKAFLLDRDYVPGPNVWTLTTPIAVPAGAIWTSALR